MASVTTINLVLEIEARPIRSLNPGLAVKGVVSPDHVEVGAMVRRAFAGAKALRDAGLV
jgi:hypothetical protein